MNIYQQAIEKWGADNQITKIQEECLELSLTINNMACPTKDKIEAYENFIDECADVIIMMRQAELIIGKEILDSAIDKKLEKLKKHISK